MVATIHLTEYEPKCFPQEQFSTRQAELLWRRHRHQVVVEPPSFKTEGQWQLTAQGWIGFLPLEQNQILALQPKISLSNIFGMLSYAYEIDEIPFETQLVDVLSLDGYVDRLAYHLVELIRRQQQVGLYQAYDLAEAPLPYIRGQIDVEALVASPLVMSTESMSLYRSDIVCRFDELTFDIMENRILAWTLHLLGQSTASSTQLRNLCKRVLSDFGAILTLRPCTIHDCNQVEFHRLNRDYKPLIALCRFFIGNCEPSHQPSNERSREQMLPFLINTASLFERFVAAWLRRHLSSELRLHVQERRAIGLYNNLHFAIDLAIYDRTTGLAKYVMDTKYKLPKNMPDTADIAQVVAYAEAIGAPEAILIYPAALTVSLDEQIGRIRVRSLSFDLAGNLMESGRAFLKFLLN